MASHLIDRPTGFSLMPTIPSIQDETQVSAQPPTTSLEHLGYCGVVFRVNFNILVLLLAAVFSA